jgi:hypothetical protein
MCDQKLLTEFRDISGQRSKRPKTLEISNKSTVQARVMMLGASDSFWLATIMKKNFYFYLH